MYADYASKSDRMRGRRNLRILIFYFSVMKKSKMDWEAHRKKDNLEEELNNVKNSKKSIVDKNPHVPIGGEPGAKRDECVSGSDDPNEPDEPDYPSYELMDVIQINDSVIIPIN